MTTSPPEPLQYSGITMTNNESSLDHRDDLTGVAAAVEKHDKANGLALILCNEYKSQDKSLNFATLPGAVRDGKNMEAAFHTLNYATILRCNLSMQATMDTLRDIARFKYYPASYKRIVVVFSGHGTSQQQLYANDGVPFFMQDMVSLLSPRQAPHLGNTPKLFFIDACRGKLKDQGIYIAAKGGSNDVQDTIAIPKGGSICNLLRVPSEGNCLVAYSTLPEHMSFESSGGGLWMSCLADQITTVDKTITDILIDVNRELIKKFNFGLPGIQQPEYVSQLNETINFYAEANLKKTLDKEGDFRLSESRSGDSEPASHCMAEFHSRYCQPRVLIPFQCTTNYVERLSGFCVKEGKPEPTFKVYNCKRKTFVAQVYVAKTKGWTKGSPASSWQQAKEDAARTLLEKLHL